MQIFKALAAGLVVAVILIEALCAAVQVLTPELDLLEAVHGDLIPPPAVASSLALAWFLGGIATGTMSTAMGGSRGAGWIAGLMLCIPPGLIMVSSGPATGILALAGLPFAGAIAGSAIAGRVEQIHHFNSTGPEL